MITFPDNPSIGDTYTHEKITYTYQGNTFWKVQNYNEITIATDEQVFNRVSDDSYLTPHNVHSLPLNAPVGSLMMWFNTSTPTGYLRCDGQSYDYLVNNGYEQLAELFPNGLPNVRNYYPRVHDDILNNDVEYRNVLSTQNSAQRRLTGLYDQMCYVFRLYGIVNGMFTKGDSSISSIRENYMENSNMAGVTFDNNRQVRTSDKFKPNSLTMYLIVRSER